MEVKHGNEAPPPLLLTCVHRSHPPGSNIRFGTCEYRRRGPSDIGRHSSGKGREAGRVLQVCLREGGAWGWSLCTDQGAGQRLLESHVDTGVRSRPLMARSWCLPFTSSEDTACGVLVQNIRDWTLTLLGQERAPNPSV